MASNPLYTFSQSISDPVALQSYLSNYVGDPFDYLTYSSGTGLLTVYTTEGTFSAATNTLISDALVNYPNTASPLRPVSQKPGSLSFSSITDGTSLQHVSNILSVKLVPVSKGGTGLTTVPAGELLFGNTGTALASTSSLNYSTASTLLTAPQVKITSSTGSTSTITGALICAGGFGLSGNAYIGGLLRVTGASTFTGAVTVPAPTAATNPTTKTYVDALVVTAGTGLTKTGTVLSVNASQSQITALGTLTGLVVSGPANFISTVTVPTPQGNTEVANKAYVDGLLVTAGTGLTKSGTSLSVNASLNHVTSLGTLTGLTSSGPLLLTNNTPATTLGTGSLIVSGGASIDGAVFVSGPASFGGQVSVPVTPVNPTDASSKSYIDLQSSSALSYINGLTYLNAGTGLTKSGSTLSVAASQTQVTSVGTLTGLSSSGNVVVSAATPSSSSTTGSIVTAGGIGLAGDIRCGGLIYTGNGMYCTSSVIGVSLANAFRVRNTDPVNTTTILSLANSAATGQYTSRFLLNTLASPEAGSNTESLVLEATSSGAGLYWNAVGTGTFRPMTLYGNTVFNANGTLSQTNVTPSVSTTSGAVTIAGGIGISGAVFAGSGTFVGQVTIPTVPTNAAHAAAKSYVDGLTFLTAGTGLTKTGATLSINASQTSITSVGTLTSLAVSGAASITSNAISSTPASGALIVAGGIGLGGNLNAAGSVSISGSSLTLGHANPVMAYTNNAAAAPTFTNRSIGTKISFKNDLSVAGSTEYALGMTATSLWNSVSNSTGAFQWYAGVTPIMQLNGTGSLNIGNATIAAFSNGAWIDLPTTGPSGIGTGGPGTNCWIGYAQTDAHWFNNSLAGDVCYRNTTGRLLFGNTNNLVGMALVGDNLGIGTTSPVARLDVNGDARVTGTLAVNNALQLTGSTSGAALVKAPPAVSTYTMTMPPNLPATTQTLAVNPTGALGYMFNVNVYDGTILRSATHNVIYYYETALTTGGAATFYPTTNAATTGTSLFPNVILYASAFAVINTTTASSVASCCVRTISADRKTVTFNVVMGTTSVFSGSAQFVANNTVVYAQIVGY